MAIGTNLFAQLSTEGFARTQTQIANLQSRISAGTNDPAPSADPVRADRLSAANEMRDKIDRFAQNANTASDELALTDTVLSDVSTMVQQLREMALRAVNSTTTDDAALALRGEAQKLREAMLVAANSRDAAGQPLFSGYSGALPYQDTEKGLVFSGDVGRRSLRLSEGLTLNTSINGSEVFGTSEKGIFAAIDNLVAALNPENRNGGNSVTAEGSALISIPLSRAETEISFRLTGPLGSADIKVPMVADTPGPMIEAISAAMGETGISAQLAVDGSSILLTSGGEISMSAASRSDDSRGAVLNFTPLEGNAAKAGQMVLTGGNLSTTTLIKGFDDAVATIANARAEVGVLGQVADQQITQLQDRSLRLENAVGKLEELDMAEAVTRLQTLLMTQQASQQTFVKIHSSGLFNYLR